MAAKDPAGTVTLVDAAAALLRSYEGDGHVPLVESPLQGAQALLRYGNASRPGSAYVTG